MLDILVAHGSFKITVQTSLLETHLEESQAKIQDPNVKESSLLNAK